MFLARVKTSDIAVPSHYEFYTGNDAAEVYLFEILVVLIHKPLALGEIVDLVTVYYFKNALVDSKTVETFFSCNFM